MINAVTLIGRLTKKPELKTTQSGLSVVQFIGSHNGQQGQQESTGWSSQPQPDAGKSSPFSESTPEVSSDDLPF